MPSTAGHERGGRARDPTAAWAASGAMALTGRPEGRPLGPPAPLVPRLDEVASLISQRSSALGHAVLVDPLEVLAARAAIAGLQRGGQVSCGGATRLLPTRDGWIAVSLARPDDVDLVAAWLELDDVPGPEVWPAVARSVLAGATDELVARGALLGMPVGGLPAAPPTAPRASLPLAPLPCRADRLGDHAATTDLADLLVVDLSSLWAGPLCGSLLARAGARVVKVESTGRPDGARHGPSAFFDLLNGDKRSVAVDLRTREGRSSLRALVEHADVVVEASRPRALGQLGIDAEAGGGAGRPRVWVSITGHGRCAPGRDRVAFGDDAAVSGGLVAWDGGRPFFCADAVADPATGLVAAAACLDALASGGRWLLDVALAGVAARLAGPTLPVPTGLAPAPPAAPAPARPAPGLGEHTAELLAEVGAAP